MSMPVTSLDYRSRADLPDLASVLGHIDTTSYLFGEDDKERNAAVSPPDQKAYFQMSSTKDEFPILVRRDGAGNGMQLPRIRIHSHSTNPHVQPSTTSMTLPMAMPRIHLRRTWPTIVDQSSST